MLFVIFIWAHYDLACESVFVLERQLCFNLIYSPLAVSHVLKRLCLCASLRCWCRKQPDDPGVQVGLDKSFRNEIGLIEIPNPAVTNLHLNPNFLELCSIPESPRLKNSYGSIHTSRRWSSALTSHSTRFVNAFATLSFAFTQPVFNLCVCIPRMDLITCWPTATTLRRSFLATAWAGWSQVVSFFRHLVAYFSPAK